MNSHYTKIILIVFLLSGIWYIYAGKGETMDTKQSVAASSLPEIDMEQPKNTETATFALG
jgi:hypothetical protein